MEFPKPTIRNILSSQLVKNTLKLSSSNILLYFLPIIVTPILSREYTPSYFGDWGIFSSTFVLISVIMFLSYDYVIIQAKEFELGNVLALNFIIGILFIILTYTTFKVFAYNKISFFSQFQYLDLLCLYLFFNLFQVIFQNYLNRYKLYTALSISNILIGISQAVLRISFGLFPLLFLNGLIAGTVYAHFIGVLFLLIILIKCHIKERVPKIIIKDIPQIISKYKNFPLYDAPASLLVFAASNITIIILSLYYSKEQIGGYSMIIQLMILPISFIGSAMGKVYYQQLASNEQNISDVRLTTLSVIKILIYLSVVPSLFIVLGGDHLIVVFLGNKWDSVGVIAICLCVWSIPTIITEPLKYIFKFLNKQRLQLIIVISYFFVSILSLIITCECGLSLKNVLIVYSFSCASVRFLLLSSIMRLVGISFKMLPKFSIYCIGITIILIGARCLILSI